MYLGLDMSLSHQGQCFQKSWYVLQVDITLLSLIVYSLNDVRLFTPPWTLARLLRPPLSPRVCSNLCPLSQ